MNRDFHPGDGGGTAKSGDGTGSNGNGLEFASIKFGDTVKSGGEDKASTAFLKRMKEATLGTEAGLEPTESAQLHKLETAFAKSDPNGFGQLIAETNADRGNAQRVLTTLSEALASVGVVSQVTGDQKSGYGLSLFGSTEQGNYVMSFNPDGTISQPDKHFQSLANQFPLSLKPDYSATGQTRFSVTEGPRPSYSTAFMAPSPDRSPGSFASLADVPPTPKSFLEKLRRVV